MDIITPTPPQHNDHRTLNKQMVFSISKLRKRIQSKIDYLKKRRDAPHYGRGGQLYENTPEWIAFWDETIKYYLQLEANYEAVMDEIPNFIMDQDFPTPPETQTLSPTAISEEDNND